MYYFDSAATSYPKPSVVRRAMHEYMDLAGSPGRSGHFLSRRAEEIIWDSRESVGRLFGASDPASVVFTQNATMALNLAIYGVAASGRVLSGAFEHNSVARPLHWLRQSGVKWDVIPPSSDSPIDLEVLESELSTGDVHTVVLAHASNVTGATVPITEVYRLCRDRRAVLIVDAAQTAGHVPITCDDADLIAFSGHKGLFGPQGTGGLVVSSSAPPLTPLLRGGTGGRSELLEQPWWLPYALEAGTPNGVGIAGLGAAVRLLLDEVGLDQVRRQETELREELKTLLEKVAGCTVHDWPSTETPVPVVSLSFRQLKSMEVAERLEEDYNILVRAGLHCAPMAHATLNTFDSGTVRVSMSRLTSQTDIHCLAEALAEIEARI